jgi:hypothetical protein
VVATAVIAVFTISLSMASGAPAMPSTLFLLASLKGSLETCQAFAVEQRSRGRCPVRSYGGGVLSPNLLDVSLEIYPFLRRTFLKLFDVLFVRCGACRSVDSSAKLNRDEAAFVVFDRFRFSR